MNVKIGQVILEFLRNALPAFDAVFIPFIRRLAMNSVELKEKKDIYLIMSKSIGNAVLGLVLGMIYIFVARLDFSAMLFVLFVVVLLMYLPVKKIRDRVVETNEEIIKDLPDLLGILVLLLETGLTVRATFIHAVEIISKESRLYAILNECVLDIQNGASEEAAFLALANNTSSRELNRFCGYMVQNIKNGSKELVSYLNVLKAECEMEKKVLYKAKGEQMSSKLLIPMAMLLVAVLVITAGPAVISLK